MELDPRTEQQAHLLIDADNRAILSILNEAGQSLHAQELADRLVADEIAIAPAEDYDDHLDSTLISLHHVRLPKLAEAGLVEYDPESNRVAYQDPPSLDVEWHDGTTIDELISQLQTGQAADDRGIEVITGRDAVIEHGRRLADEAEEELFCMYISTDLLEDECIRRGQAAIDRGVRLDLGSQNPQVRELTRQRLPDASVWEPQLDWLNTPSYPRVGRLVFIDRRKVMLAILEEPAPDGTHPDETAVVGEGEDHPLVVLVRELLGSRLDHLDFQSEEFRSTLPS